MKTLNRLVSPSPGLLLGAILMFFPLLTWAGHARISCTPPPVYDAGSNWSDVAVPIPISLPEIMDGGNIVKVDPSQVVQCMLIASNNIQSIGNHGTTTPNIVSPFLSDFGNSNIIFLMSEMINPQVLIYSASAGKYGAFYFPVQGAGVINAGDTLFTVTYNSSVALANTRDSGFNVVISFVAANRSVIVQRNCDFSSQSTSVSLPEYSVAGTSAFPVGLSLSCTAGSDVGITMNLTGTTLSDDNTVFTSDGSAQGVGVRFYYNSQPVAANQELQAGYVNGNNVPTNLGLSVAYARTGGRLTAGTVRSRVNLTLTYR
ncbi:hypothetical protein [Pantoea stewartii]|uniref:hypothetical protein n=1 Tax=Pantoea stewartii TaxID=66269 RepID=UPI000A9B90F0|nr:hypothetical protein [Pantoea stewartii]